MTSGRFETRRDCGVGPGSYEIRAVPGPATAIAIGGPERFLDQAPETPGPGYYERELGGIAKCHTIASPRTPMNLEEWAALSPRRPHVSETCSEPLSPRKQRTSRKPLAICNSRRPVSEKCHTKDNIQCPALGSGELLSRVEVASARALAACMEERAEDTLRLLASLGAIEEQIGHVMTNFEADHDVLAQIQGSRQELALDVRLVQCAVHSLS